MANELEQDLKDRIQTHQTELERIEAEKTAKRAEAEKELREIETRAAERQQELLETSQRMEEAEKVFLFSLLGVISVCQEENSTRITNRTCRVFCTSYEIIKWFRTCDIFLIMQ